MAESPQRDADGVLCLSIHCAGVAQPGLPVLSVTLRHAFNEIPWARLELSDGDLPNGRVPLSDGDLFKPGVEITVKAGCGGAEATTLFTGIVVRHGLRISGSNGCRLMVECRAGAFRMALSRRTLHHVNRTDAQVIEGLIAEAGLSGRVAATAITHSGLVQYDCTDWDFMVARAEAMGLLVNASGLSVSVQPPRTDADAELRLTWGEDLIDFDADIDARTPPSVVQASSWSPTLQSMLQGESSDSHAFTRQGHPPGSEPAAFAPHGSLSLQTCAPQDPPVLDAWARAAHLKTAMARLQGRMSFQGSALAQPGAAVELRGLGQRFSGTVMLSAVEHQIQDGQWITQAQFGMDPRWIVQRPDVMAAPNGGLLPGVGGLQIGVVLQIEGDPAQEHRILVRLPACQTAPVGLWAWLLQVQASDGFGSFFVPEIGDEVLLGHLNQDPCHPVVLGSLYSRRRQPPYALADRNGIQAVVSRSGHRIEFNDADRRITIATPTGNQLVLDDRDQVVVVRDQNGNSVRLSEAGIALDSPKDIRLVAQGGITLDAVGAISIRSAADVGVDGLNVRCEAQVGLIAKGVASAELSASGQTTVKGALVMIN